MNNPEDMPIDVEEILAWARSYKEGRSMSWATMAQACGIPAGTLSAVVGGSYGGNPLTQAKRLYRFRQQVESQDIRKRSALAAPKYVETPASRRIQFLLEIAQMGRITVAAMGPGTGKTMTARHYANSVSNVWMATMRQSTKGLAPMIGQVMKAIGLEPRQSWTQLRSGQVSEFVTGRGGLIIIDEANHLSWEALEELRGWNDVENGVGIALLGNEELMMRIRGGKDRHAFARLRSRIANYHIQDMPTEADVAAYLDALEIEERPIRRLLIGVALSPEHGGLREVQQILETAHMLAIGDEEPLGQRHVQDAMSSRATSQMRRAA